MKKRDIIGRSTSNVLEDSEPEGKINGGRLENHF